MRVRLTFCTGLLRSEIPINYNGDVSRFVFQALRPDYALLSRHGGAQPIHYYTFSNLDIPNVRQEGRSLIFGDVPISFTVSVKIGRDSEQELLERISSAEALDFTPGGGPVLHLTQIQILCEPRHFGRVARFRMASPLASPCFAASLNSLPFSTDSGIPIIHYSSPSFSEAIREGLVERYIECHGRGPRDTEFRITIDPRYIQRRRGRISKLVTIDESTSGEQRIRAIVAPFECEGNPELIALGYVAGFGEKTLLGFGCVESASEPAYAVRTISLRPPIYAPVLNDRISASGVLQSR